MDRHLPWLVQAMAAFVQSENFFEITWKSRVGVRVQFACDPQMLIEHRFQIARDNGFRNSMCISLSAAGERDLKKRAVQIGAQPVPAEYVVWNRISFAISRRALSFGLRCKGENLVGLSSHWKSS